MNTKIFNNLLSNQLWKYMQTELDHYPGGFAPETLGRFNIQNPIM